MRVTYSVIRRLCKDLWIEEFNNIEWIERILIMHQKNSRWKDSVARCTYNYFHLDSAYSVNAPIGVELSSSNW